MATPLPLVWRGRSVQCLLFQGNTSRQAVIRKQVKKNGQLSHKPFMCSSFSHLGKTTEEKSLQNILVRHLPKVVHKEAFLVQFPSSFQSLQDSKKKLVLVNIFTSFFYLNKKIFSTCCCTNRSANPCSS